MGAVRGSNGGLGRMHQVQQRQSHRPQHPNSTRNLAMETTLLERAVYNSRWRPISHDAPHRRCSSQVPLTRSPRGGTQARVAELRNVVVRDTSAHMAASTQPGGMLDTRCIAK